MKNLTELSQKWGTDKLTHGYIPFYEKHLPPLKEMDSFLEIGVYRGQSCQMFDEYFDHKVEFHLLDLFEEEGNMTEREARAKQFITHKGSQTDLKLLESIGRTFNVISEDASHNAGDQLITFKHCFLNTLRSGGVYFLEDLHCNTDPFYWNHGVKSIEDTPLNMFKNYLITGKIENFMFNEGESETFENLILKVEFGADDKIVAIWRK